MLFYAGFGDFTKDFTTNFEKISIRVDINFIKYVILEYTN